MNAKTLTPDAAAKIAAQVAQLKATATANYELDGGMMAETFTDESYAAAIAESKTAAKAWKLHMQVNTARRESMDVQPLMDAEEFPGRATPKQIKAAKETARVRADVANQTAAIVRADRLAAQEATALPAADTAAASAAPVDTPAPADRQEAESAPKQAPTIPSTGYNGPMRALRDRVKAGAYKKAANGQPSCGDEVAQILGALEPVEVIRACLDAMAIANPYGHLNIGQQSMNLRNKLRGQLKRNDIGMGVLREAVEGVIEQRPAKPTGQVIAGNELAAENMAKEAAEPKAE